MKFFLKSGHWYGIFIIIALLMIPFGCVSSKTAEKSSSGDEQAYIDFKQGFSLVIPATWMRKQVPVSSPKYRSDTVQWLIPGHKGTVTSLSVKTLPQMDISTLQQTLLGSFHQANASLPVTPLKFKHPAGIALRLDFPGPLAKTSFLAIMGPQHSYLLNFRISNEDYTQLSPVIEKIILKFSIL